MSSFANRLAEQRARWSQLERWLPHVPLWLMIVPLGAILIEVAFLSALGVSTTSIDVGALQKSVELVDLGPLVDFSLGVLILFMSVGLLRRSSLALWCSLAGLAIWLVGRVTVWEFSSPLLTLYIVAVLVLLAVNRKSFDRRSLVTPSLFAGFTIVALLAYHTLSVVKLGDHFDPPIRDVITGLYYVVVTISSLGYGDIVPSDSEGRAYAIWLVVSGLAVGATAVSAAFLPFMTSRLGALLGSLEEPVDRKNHFVITSSSPLARNTAEELEKRGQHVTLIIDAASEDSFYEKRDVVVGDPTDLEVLRTAGADRARGVLALSTVDADNGFVILGVNELAAAVPSVAALNDPKNHFRLKRTQPSLLLSLQALGGELLAKAMTGERVEADMFAKVLQLHTNADDDSSD